MAGEIQNNFQLNLPTKVSNLKPSQLTNQLINIGNELGASKPETQSKVKIVSKEKYNYNGSEGVLLKLDDGSLVFQTQQQINGKNVSHQYKFKNEKALNKKQPSSEVFNSGNLARRTVINYEYYRNGKVKNKETRIGQNKLSRQEHFDKNGKLQNRIVYDKDGKLLKNIKYTHNKDNSVDINVYDKDNKLEETVHSQYKPDGKTLISSESRYPDGNLKAESKYDANGKIQAKTEYYENQAVKSKAEYWDNGVIKEQEQYDENGKVTKKISAEIDGNFGESRQVGEGDCYLMATINSIRELDNGQEMLQKLVKVETNENGEKVYTVTLPG
ncbi:MAG: hypothetical protein K2F57_00830, partial [Candidatus Gastranaerophilales bacterium]|nr:hypothetical protein [Candidatus Gastranaerophilales bacterium]